MSSERQAAHVSLAVIISILALVAGFLWDRVHMESVAQRDMDQIEELQREDQSLKEDMSRIRDRQRLNEDRIMRLEDSHSLHPR